VRTVLIEYEPYGPWAIERDAVAAAHGTLEVIPPAEFSENIVDCDVLLNASAVPVPRNALDAMPSLRCAVSYGVGVDWIDVADATRRGIMVANMPSANVEDVATHTVALLLACARRLPELDHAVRLGDFDWPRSRPIHRLRTLQLGLLAFGSIPRIVASLMMPFGMRIVAHDPFVSPQVLRDRGVTPVSIEELFSTSEAVSVHVPLAPETHGLVDKRLLGLLPTGGIFVCTSRGEVYDVDALMDALASTQISAAGLDVFPEEPLPLDHPLQTLQNVILTPHVAGYSEEAIADLHAAAAAVIASLAEKRQPPGLVNPHAFVVGVD
jgi:D-3-phosphoglycerate dehydrogenase